MTVALTPAQTLSGIAALLMLLVMWRAGVRQARAAADPARAGARLMSLLGRVLFTAGLIVGVQWLVITHPAVSKWVVLAVLGLPAVFASYALTRALTVTIVDTEPRRGRR